MKKIVFLFSIIVFIYSCNPGKIEKRELCEDISDCHELYLVNTSKTKAYKFIINWKKSVISVDYPYDYTNGNLSKSDKELFDRRVFETQNNELKGTYKINLLPGESDDLGPNLMKEDLYLYTKESYTIYPKTETRKNTGFTQEQTNSIFNEKNNEKKSKTETQKHSGFTKEQMNRLYNEEKSKPKLPEYHPSEKITARDVITYKVDWEIVGYLETNE